MGRVHSINRPHSLSIPDGRSYRFAQSAYSWDFSLLCIYESCVGPNGSFRNWLCRFQLSLLWGGAVVGLLAMFYPQVCGNGKGLMTSLFHQNWDFYTVLFLVIVKLIATSVTFGSGAVGGVFTPTHWLLDLPLACFTDKRCSTLRLNFIRTDGFCSIQKQPA
jgi:hypothetical protein